MSKFSRRSWENLKDVDPRLVALATRVLERIDITVLCGYRDKEQQNIAYGKGTSQLKYPKSKHNKKPSQAIDICPYPVDWDNIAEFNRMCDIVLEEAEKLGINVRLGREFSFKDYPHVELVEEV
jgi:peptidoglycan L-alanyl-D-glutamate endopeptidase CwlK